MEHSQPIQPIEDILQEGARSFGVELDRQAISRLSRYFLELLRWNAKTNLTGLKDDRDIAITLFVDSLACLQAFPAGKDETVLDIGSGAGFPGLPIKIVAPAHQVDLLEPRQKKVAFLHYMVGILCLQGVDVLSKRVQDLVRIPAYHRRYSRAFTRAVEVHDILPSIAPLLKERGTLILCRASPFKENVACYGFTLTNELSYDLPSGRGKRILSVLELSASTGPQCSTWNIAG